MKSFPILYKRASTGAVQQWQIFADNNQFWTEAGQVGGTISVCAPTICEAKNTGRANATTATEQAEAEAEAKQKKKLKTGYTVDINDVDTCKTYFSPMLAHKFVDHKDKVKYPAFAGRKIDGARMVNVTGATTSRNGEPMVSCPHIGHALIPFFKKYPEGMVDGEIYASNEAFEKVMSLVKKSKPTIADLFESEEKCKLWVFDGLLDDDQERFDNRFKRVKQAILETVKPEHLHYFVFVENVVVNNHEEFLTEHDKYVAEGFEGAILRVINAPYENKRSKYLLKYKVFVDDEFTIVDLLEGKGSDAGRVSKLLVQLANGGTSEAGIRGTNEYTAQLLKDRVQYLGKKATVRYQGFTQEGKLRFGVAVNIDPFDR